MSFLTCFWLFPQKEHLSKSPVSPTRGTRGSSLRSWGCRWPRPVVGPIHQSVNATRKSCGSPLITARRASCRTDTPGLGVATRGLVLDDLSGRDDLVHNPVFTRLVGGEDL